MGYRYFDTFHKEALFPFGYGLSYTKFELKTQDVQAAGDEITVKVMVKNVGAAAGKEVVQVYVSMPKGTLDKPYQDLVGFAKTSLLEPGEEELVPVTFRLSEFASYSREKEAYLLEAGTYVVRVGNSSVHTSAEAALHLDQTVVTRKTKNCLGTPDFADLQSESEEPEVLPEGIRELSLACEEFPTEQVSFDRAECVDARAKRLPDEKLAYLQIGSFAEKKGSISIVGNAGSHVAGAAGETTSALKEHGIGNLIMADGPAGLRLAKEYYEDRKGAHDGSGAGMIPQSILDFMNPVERSIALAVTGGSHKPPKNAVIKEHMATMIPIGTAIAQSFNCELARAYGDLVGEEMELMGVNLWLAPALNIHRSILCGRNFEYYSEDPLVSGLMAAAITEGVQAHHGCATCIKHFAANNSETNRYCNNSQVSERAMREIYLRGFEICVKKAQPHAVMTSYNLLNGVHTSEHRGLIQEILRSEFGFEGIVMTDWVIGVMTSKQSIYRNALADEVAMAGGDLFMPGSEKDYKQVLKALKEGRLTREQLEINASRVLRMIDLLK